MKIQKVWMGIVGTFVSLSALAQNPAISDVIVQQRWPWSRLVDIDYVLKCDDLKQLMDVNIEVYNGDDLLDVSEFSFSGDLFSVQCGARRIVWDPTGIGSPSNSTLPEFRVSLTPTPVPLYMIIDLTMPVGTEGQTAYVYESDLTNGLWGAWERNPVTNRGAVVESVIWTGVTTNDIYKTDKLVLRRLSKGTFAMGSGNPPTVSTTLTKDFYAGVFQVTQSQWELIMGNNPNANKNPVFPIESISYHAIRGAVTGAGWPSNDFIDVSSFMGQLGIKTGLAGFDLPTDAQWEYACRAGTTTLFNDGDALANVSGTNVNANVWLDVLGWWKNNSGGSVHPVGEKTPNAWGLYDMHGNVLEWCLDFYVKNAPPQGGVDPKGAESSTYRTVRGGSKVHNAVSCQSATVLGNTPSSGYGFRLVRDLP